MPSKQDEQILGAPLTFEGDPELLEHFENELELNHFQSQLTEKSLDTLEWNEDSIDESKNGGAVDSGIFVSDHDIPLILEVGLELPDEPENVLELDHIQLLPANSEKNSLERDKVTTETENGGVLDDIELLGRKKRAKPDSWTQNLRKTLREKGEEYFNRKGVIVSQRQMKSPCKEACRRKCREKITEEERKQIFKKFWNLSDTEKSHFMAQFIKRVKTEKKIPGYSRRTCTFQYYLEKDDIQQLVCKQFFLSTLDISERRIYYFFENKQTSDGIPEKKKRNRNRGPNYTEEDIEEVKQHIRSFPCVDSHYCRGNSAKKYLDPHLNVSKMYQLYRESSSKPVTESVYRNVFNFSFNLDFHKPKKDQCAKCVLHKYGKVPQEDYDQHMLCNTYAKEERARDRETDAETAIISYDLQKVIALPKGFASVLYYKRKLSVFNLTGQCNLNKVTYCAIWDETESGRSGDDIASALAKIIRSVIIDNPSVKKIVLWSDSCVPQNKNKINSTAILQNLYDHPHITSIEQKFSEPGHSRIQEVDAVHSVLDRALNRVEIYNPDMLVRLLQNFKFKNVHLKVLKMAEDDFKNYSSKADQLSWEKLPFSKVRGLRYESENKFSLKFKSTLNKEEEWSVVSILKRKRKFTTPPNIFAMQMKKMRFGVELSVDKKKDLESILDFIPEEEQYYFKKIFKQEPKLVKGGKIKN